MQVVLLFFFRAVLLFGSVLLWLCFGFCVFVGFFFCGDCGFLLSFAGFVGCCFCCVFPAVDFCGAFLLVFFFCGFFLFLGCCLGFLVGLVFFGFVFFAVCCEAVFLLFWAFFWVGGYMFVVVGWVVGVVSFGGFCLCVCGVGGVWVWVFFLFGLWVWLGLGFFCLIWGCVAVVVPCVVWGFVRIGLFFGSFVCFGFAGCCFGVCGFGFFW